MGQEQPDFIHPANVAREVGAEVLRGPLIYPSETDGLQLGDLDLSEYLHKYRDCEITLIITATGGGGKAGRVRRLRICYG